MKFWTILILKHLLLSILAIILTTFIVYWLIYDVAPLSVNWEGMTPEQISLEKHIRGLDISYYNWWSGIIRGNMGVSVRSGSVSEKVMYHLYNTLIIAFGALIISFVISAFIGFWSAFSPRSKLSRLALFIVSMLSCIPIFLSSLLIKEIYERAFNQYPQNAIACLLALIALGFGDGSISEMSKYLNDSALKILSEDYMIAVRAKNVSIFRHFTKNMLIPILSIVSSRFTLFISATIIVEYVFNYKGIGYLTFTSLMTDEYGLRDYPTIMGGTLAMVVVIVIIRLICSLIQPLFDPRLRDDERP